MEFWDRNKLNFKNIDTTKGKIGLIKNGLNIKIIEDIIKYPKFTLVFAPRKSKDKNFENDYNKCRNKNHEIDKSVYEIENRSANIDDYVFIHKEDYQEYLKFKENNSKKLDIDSLQQQKIKDRYLVLKSQRKLAKEFGVSSSTINRILNDKY